MAQMAKDPRFENDLPVADSVGEYFTAYTRELAKAAGKVSQEKIQEAFELLAATLKRNQRIYVAGNGGSCAIADHLCCDFMKGTHVHGKPALKVHSLTSSPALLTALSNDFGYETSLSRQVEMLGEAGDILILISSSGNSPNIVKAVEAAHAKKMKVIGLCGFSGGKLAATADVPLYVPVHNYGIAEDVHQMLMHAFAQFLAQKRDSEK